MKRIIFTSYDDLNDNNLLQTNFNSKDKNSEYFNKFLKDKKGDDKDIIAKKQITDYFDRLVENKKNYANSIGVDFKFYHNTMQNFFVSDELEFTKVNLYKHHLMHKLAEEYDEVMYIDMDVVFNTKKNVFEELELNKGIHILDQDEDIHSKDINELLFKKIGLRNPTLKYHITKDLLNGKDNHVINTGVVIGKSKHLKQIKLVERLPGIIAKINNLKNQIVFDGNPVYLRAHYYPNNESAFSYILEEYNIPYVIMDKKWHTICDHVVKQKSEAEIYHFINKNFYAFFKNKTKAVFSIYVKIDDANLDNPKGYANNKISKSKQTQILLEQYKDDLYKNKKEYAKSIGAEFILFERNEKYETFLKRFPDLSEYDVVNLYKIYLLDELTKQYDYVLYLDYDVIALNNIDFFEHVPVENAIGCFYFTAEDLNIPKDNSYYFKDYNWDFRSPHSKYWNAHALLSEEYLDPENVIFNTGVIGASRKMMAKLDYFSDIDKIIQTMKDLKESSMYPKKVQAAFGYDNETIFSYKVKKNNVPIHLLGKYWHYKHEYKNKYSFIKGTSFYKADKYELEINVKKHNVVFAHFISKNFGIFFDKDNL